MEGRFVITIQRLTRSSAPAAAILIRILVGAVFFSEGIQKFLFSDTLGVGRFAKIGIPEPATVAPFVGVVEIVFGAFILLGFLTRLSAVPLLIDISVAIATTKVPMLLDKGFWAAAHEARTDVSMLLGLIFLLTVGAGPWSVDARAFRDSSQKRISAIWRIQRGATLCRKLPPVPDTACAIKARNSSGVYARRMDWHPSSTFTVGKHNGANAVNRASGTRCRTRSRITNRRQARPTFRIISTNSSSRR